MGLVNSVGMHIQFRRHHHSPQAEHPVLLHQVHVQVDQAEQIAVECVEQSVVTRVCIVA